MTALLPTLQAPSSPLTALLGTGEAEQDSDTKQSCPKGHENWTKGRALGRRSAFHLPPSVLHMREVRPRGDTDLTKVTK